MNSNSTLDVPVLIVGGGPAGLTTALELHRRGIRGALIDRRGFTNRFPRAHLLNVRTMETFADIGVAEEVYAMSPPEDQWHRVAWYTTLAGKRPGRGLRLGHLDAWGGGTDLGAYREASPRAFANVPQIRLDEVLARAATAAWGENVMPFHELQSLQQDDDGVTAEVMDLKTGERKTFRAQYVVAADGGRTVADMLGVDVVGPRALKDIVNVYFTADLSEVADEEALLTYFINPEGQGSMAGAIVAMGPERWGRHSHEWNMSINHTVETSLADERELILDKVRRLIGVKGLEFDVRAISHWQFEGVVAEKFSVGRIFIAGDAAHRHPPTGGLGLNTAVGDASNLGWKLAAVLKNQADATLLETYQAERQPVAARNVEHSLVNANRHAVIAQSVGLAAGQSEGEGWEAIRQWQEAQTPAGHAARAATVAAVADNAEDYSQLNIEAGFCYDSHAVIPDGSPAPDNLRSATDFQTNARPGHHVPHVWLGPEEARVSSSDLVASEGLTVFVDASAEPKWQGCAEIIAQETGCPLSVVAVGAGRHLDQERGWAMAAGVDASGVVVVRPDRHVAFRAATYPGEPADVLRQVIGTVMRGKATAREHGWSESMDRVHEAGERIRALRGQAPKLFAEA